MAHPVYKLSRLHKLYLFNSVTSREIITEETKRVDSCTRHTCQWVHANRAVRDVYARVDRFLYE